MKLSAVSENSGQPTVAYRQNGDGTYTVRVVAPNGKVFVHTNRDKRALEKIVRERYTNPNITWN